MMRGSPLAAGKARSWRAICEAARQVGCEYCRAAPGKECVAAGVAAHPAYGYHLSRFARAMRDELISGPELTVALETAVVCSDAAVVWDETSVEAPGTGRDRYGLLLSTGDRVHVEFEGFGTFVGPDGGNGLNVQIGDDEIVSCAIQQVRRIGCGEIPRPCPHTGPAHPLNESGPRLCAYTAAGLESLADPSGRNPQ